MRGLHSEPGATLGGSDGMNMGTTGAKLGCVEGLVTVGVQAAFFLCRAPVCSCGLWPWTLKRRLGTALETVKAPALDRGKEQGH